MNAILNRVVVKVQMPIDLNKARRLGQMWIDQSGEQPMAVEDEDGTLFDIIYKKDAPDLWNLMTTFHGTGYVKLFFLAHREGDKWIVDVEHGPVELQDF